MTVIDSFPVRPELVAFLKQLSPAFEHEETQLECYIHSLSGMQNFLCKHLIVDDCDQLKEISQLIESVMYIREDLTTLAKLLPVITRES